MDGTLAQIITDLLQSQQALVRAQQQMETLTRQIEVLTKERDALRDKLSSQVSLDTLPNKTSVGSV